MRGPVIHENMVTSFHRAWCRSGVLQERWGGCSSRGAGRATCVPQHRLCLAACLLVENEGCSGYWSKGDAVLWQVGVHGKMGVGDSKRQCSLLAHSQPDGRGDAGLLCALSCSRHEEVASGGSKSDVQGWRGNGSSMAGLANISPPPTATSQPGMRWPQTFNIPSYPIPSSLLYLPPEMSAV